MGLFDHLCLFGPTPQNLTPFSAGTGLHTGYKHVRQHYIVNILCRGVHREDKYQQKKVHLALSSQSACAMHCMWFLKSLNNFLPREENRHTALPFVCKVIANPLLLPGSLHWPQEQKAFLMKCTALPFCGMPSKQKHFLCLTPGLGLLGNRSFLTTPPACQQHLFGEAGSTLLSHGKSRSGIFFFHLSMFLWSQILFSFPS